MRTALLSKTSKENSKLVKFCVREFSSFPRNFVRIKKKKDVVLNPKVNGVNTKERETTLGKVFLFFRELVVKERKTSHQLHRQLMLGKC
jgi:hypothetical protein